MADPLSRFFSKQVEGFAVVLPVIGGLSNELRVAVSQASARAKARQGQLERLSKVKLRTPNDVHMLFSRKVGEEIERAQKQLEKLIASGDVLAAERFAEQASSDIALAASASKDAGDYIVNLIKEADKEGVVNVEKFTERIGNIIAGKDPRDLDLSELTFENVLLQPGGSEMLDTKAVMAGIIDDRMPKAKVIVEGAFGRPESVGFGQVKFKRQDLEAELRPYQKIDPVTGKVIIKNEDELIEEGILDAFMSDRFAARIVDDVASKKFSDLEATEARAKALHDILSDAPFNDGSVRTKVKEQIRSIPSALLGGGGDDRKEGFLTSAEVFLMNVRRAFSGDLPAGTEIVKFEGKDVFDVSELFGGGDDGSKVIAPFTIRTPDGKTINASKVLADIDEKRLIVLDSAGRVISRFAPGREEGASPIADALIVASKTFKDDLIEIGSKRGFINEDGEFIVGTPGILSGRIQENKQRMDALVGSFERQLRFGKVSVSGASKPLSRIVTSKNPSDISLGEKTVNDFLASGFVVSVDGVPSKVLRARAKRGFFGTKPLSSAIVLETEAGEIELNGVEDMLRYLRENGIPQPAAPKF